MTTLKLLDIVKITADYHAEGIAIGQTGTIVEILADDVFEVEFINKNGETIAEFAVPASDLVPFELETVLN